MNEKINSKNIRYFNKIDVTDKYIIKSFIGDREEFKSKFFNEIIWMIKAQTLIPNNVPKVVDYSLNQNNLWMKYKIINENTVHDIFLDQENNHNENFWNTFAVESKKFIEILTKIQPLVFVKEEWRNNIFSFSLKRQLEAIKKISLDNNFKLFFEKEHIFINNKRLPSLIKIQEFLEKKIKEIISNKIDKDDIFNLLISPNKERICFVHLDLVFGNIFFDEKNKNIKVIDPRGSYYNGTEFGDIYYDYAKYYQSVYGLYDFIAEDKFNISIDKNKLNICYEITKPKNYSLIKKAFDVFFSNINIDVVKLIESLQFITMIPAHSDNYERQVVQLCVGIEHFYEVVGDEIWK